MNVFVRIGLVLAMGLAVLSNPAVAGVAAKEGFVFPASGDVRIVVFRPDVHVGSLSAGGIDEPNPDWTDAARKNIQKAMERSAEARESSMQFLPDYEGDAAALVNDYRGLFKAVSGAIFQHVMLPGSKLRTKEYVDATTKKKRYRFDWTMGSGTAQLKPITQGDYALFFYTYDSYGTAGRKVAQVLMAGLFGAYVPAGVHIGYAGLVDLSTGEIVWFNTDFAMGGDVREEDGAVKRVGQLLRGFPQRGKPIVTAQAAK